MIKGFIFDLDGVLVNTEEIQRKALLEVLARFGVEPTPEELKEQEGTLSQEFFQKILLRRGVEGFDLNKLAIEKRERALQLFQQTEITLLDGARELLQGLKRRNLKIAVGTAASRKRLALIFSKTGLDRVVDVTVAGDDVAKGKPDPEIFLMVAQKLNLQPEELIVVEDSKNGIEAAKTAKIFAIGLDNHVGQDLSGADIVVKSLREIDIGQLLNKF